MKYLKIILIIFGLQTFLAYAYAQTESNSPNAQPPKITSDPVQDRAVQEKKIPPNYYTITFYKPSYVLPYYYTASPDNAVYQGQTPEDQRIKSSEFKYQFSIKVPAWRGIFRPNSTLYLAYTQRSYWQLYAKNPFFRETDYEPEIYLANQVHYRFIKDLNITFMNVGLDHQSNGFGNQLERVWNRAYFAAILSRKNLMFTFQPWYIIKNHTLETNNPDIGRFLGHEEFIVSYKCGKQVFSLTVYNVENGIRRISSEATWSFPLTAYLKGYAQVFSGYGQSLIEYNHRTNSIGIGLALSDWV